MKIGEHKQYICYFCCICYPGCSKIQIGLFPYSALVFYSCSVHVQFSGIISSLFLSFSDPSSQPNVFPLSCLILVSEISGASFLSILFYLFSIDRGIFILSFQANVTDGGLNPYSIPWAICHLSLLLGTCFSRFLITNDLILLANENTLHHLETKNIIYLSKEFQTRLHDVKLMILVAFQMF